MYIVQGMFATTHMDGSVHQVHQHAISSDETNKAFIDDAIKAILFNFVQMRGSLFCAFSSRRAILRAGALARGSGERLQA